MHLPQLDTAPDHWDGKAPNLPQYGENSPVKIPLKTLSDLLSDETYLLTRSTVVFLLIRTLDIWDQEPKFCNSVISSPLLRTAS